MNKLIFVISIIFQLSILFSSCNLGDIFDSTEIEEDFEDEVMDDKILLFLLGDSSAEIRSEGENSYLYLELNNADYPDNQIIFGYDNCDSVLSGFYTISFDLYIEEIDSTGIISALVSTSDYSTHDPQYLFFSNDGSDYIFHGGTNDYPFTYDIYHDGRYADRIQINTGEWISVEIEPDTRRDENPSYTDVNIGVDSFSVRSFDASILQRSLFEVRSGTVKIRIDNYTITS
ncbi:MAG: hypothetical protein JEY99_07640 [Spirochaetales bacterium]|nr:hypothetical protein [Spirochaetales bacterium]